MGVTAQGFGQEGYVLDDEDIGPRPRPDPEQENFTVGVPYYLPFATPYRDSWEVFRTDPVSVQQLNVMRRQDGQARALYRLLTMPILAALKNCSVTVPDGQTGGTKEAQFIKDMLFLPAPAGGMMYPFKRFVKQMLLALFEGFSAWELIYWQPTYGPLQGKWTLREIGWRPSETLTFLLDGQGQFNGFRQRTFFQGRTIDVKIPKSTALYFANEEAERPFYGVSMFEAAFYHYDKKVKLYYITHLAAQRKAVGLRVGTMAPNPPVKDRQMFVKGLADLGLAQYMVLPNADWQVNNLIDQGQFDFLGLINHHNSQMSKSVLAQWFDNAQGGGDGDSTLVDFGKQSDVTFMMMLDSLLEDMAATINHDLIPRFIDWNFGSALYPEFRWGELTAEQKAAIQEIFTQLASAGQTANVTPDFMIALEQKMAEDLGLEDIDYDKIKADRKKQQAAMEQQVGEGMTTMGVNGVPQPLQQPGQFGQDMGQPPGSQGAGGQQGGGQGGGIPPGYLPDGFQQVQASAGQLLDRLMELSRSGS